MRATQAKERVTLALIGAGNRGADVYGRYVLEHPEAARIVAVAEPDPARRARLAAQHGIPPARCFADWRELLAGERLADGLIIATPDRAHVLPALKALALGYAILLEKPIAPTPAALEALARAARRHAGRVTVAHVLRYTAFFRTIKRLLDEGRIGRLVTMQHTENIGYWHFAHAYVRGNWRSEAAASFMLLAKACHDLDLLRWFAQSPCRRVSAFGGRVQFTRAHAPPGAPPRCTDGCPVERTCPYSAIRIYLERFGGRAEWPNTVLTPNPTPQSVRRALERGPYGRCVYRMDNDVAEHQVVALEFANGVCATLTVCAFTEANTRTVHLMGTHGEVRGHMGRGEIEVLEFTRGARQVLTVPAQGRHAGGDEGVMADFLGRLRRLKAGEAVPEAPTALEASLESHRMAFAAETARREGRVVAL